MRVLITVGTTPFDSLMRCADQALTSYELQFQIASGHYRPKNGPWFRFGEIASLYEWADIVITHAGAGSVYTLLEQQKRMIVVPNLERRDTHQKELARYIEARRFAFVLWKPEAIGEAFEDALHFQADPYVPYPFFIGEKISSLLLSGFPKGR